MALPTQARHQQTDVAVLVALRDADLAALAVCVLFDFTRLASSQRIQMELVASHMWIVWSMDRCCEYLIGGYPCEPILAVAALHHLHEIHTRGKRIHLLTVMQDALMEHHIAKGGRGEVVARLILILAFYKALSLPLVAEPSERPRFLPSIPSVSLKDFIDALFPKHFKTFWSTTSRKGQKVPENA